MEGNLNCKESFTDTAAFTSVSQHFHNETKNTQSNESVPSNYEEFYETERLISTCASPVIILFGNIGNIMTFIFMRRGSLKDVSTCCYMVILALTDTGKFKLFTAIHKTVNFN